jgi:hypothetical protein
MVDGMPIDVKDLKVGDVLYDCHRHKAGNTTMSVDGVWKCRVREVGTDENGRPWALISWSGNAPRGKTYGRTSYRRYPKEWNRQSLFDEATCALCHAKKSAGHRDSCDHPAAIRARKRAAKGAA